MTNYRKYFAVWCVGTVLSVFFLTGCSTVSSTNTPQPIRQSIFQMPRELRLYCDLTYQAWDEICFSRMEIDLNGDGEKEILLRITPDAQSNLSNDWLILKKIFDGSYVEIGKIQGHPSGVISLSMKEDWIGRKNWKGLVVRNNMEEEYCYSLYTNSFPFYKTPTRLRRKDFPDLSFERACWIFDRMHQMEEGSSREWYGDVYSPSGIREFVKAGKELADAYPEVFSIRYIDMLREAGDCCAKFHQYGAALKYYEAAMREYASCPDTPENMTDNNPASGVTERHNNEILNLMCAIRIRYEHGNWQQVMEYCRNVVGISERYRKTEPVFQLEALMTLAIAADESKLPEIRDSARGKINELLRNLNDSERREMYWKCCIENSAAIRYCRKFSSVDPKRLLEQDLILAVEHGNLRKAESLLKAGAPVNLRNEDGWSFLQKICYEKRIMPEMLALLLKYGADPRSKSLDGTLDLWDVLESETNREVFRCLVEKADFNPLKCSDGGVALIAGMLDANGLSDAVRYLVEEVGIKIDSDEASRRIVGICNLIMNDSIDMVRYLKKHGASVSLPDSEGNTLLHKAASENVEHAIELVRFLIDECGVDPTLRNKEGKRADECAKMEEVKRYLKFRVSRSAAVLTGKLFEQTGDGKQIQEAVTIWQNGNESKAKSILTPLAEKNNALALYYLGVMRYNNDDKKSAAEFFQKAAELNEPNAMFQLAKMKLGGNGIAEDFRGGFVLMKKLADLSGDPEACFLLGKLYHHGCGTDKNEESAYRYWRMAAEPGNGEPGHVLAQYICGMRYADLPNRNAEQNSEMFRYLELAAKQNYADAWRALGNHYYEGNGLSAPNYARALDCYLVAERIAPFNATEFNLGLIYRLGRGVPQDDVIAEKWFKLSAEKGYMPACCHLGRIYGNAKRYDEARKCLLLAAEQKMYQAYDLLGMMDLNEQGVPTGSQNKRNAFEWFRKSAEMGSSEGQYRLALCFQDGIGIPADAKLAKEWMEKAAAQKHPEAMRFLGIAPRKESFEEEPASSCSEPRSVYSDIVDAYYRNQEKKLWVSLRSTVLAAREDNDTKKGNMPMITLPLFDDLKLTGWDFDAAAHEQELRKHLIVDRDGYFRWKSDDYTEMPLEENLEKVNPTIRMVNQKNEEFALAVLGKSKFSPCDQEMTKKLLEATSDDIPTENFEARAWKINPELYFLMTADFSGAWHPRTYRFLAVRNSKISLLPQFDSFPTPQEAAMIYGVTCQSPCALNNLAARMESGELNQFVPLDKYVESALQSAAEKGCGKAYYNLGVFHQNRGNNRKADHFFALAKSKQKVTSENGRNPSFPTKLSVNDPLMTVTWHPHDNTIFQTVGGNPVSHLELASFIKPVIIDEAIRCGAVDWNTVIDCGDQEFEVFDGVKIHDVKPYGKLTVREILLNRSNIGTIKIAQKMGVNVLAKKLREFGISGDGMDNPKTIIGQNISVTPEQIAKLLGSLSEDMRKAMPVPYPVTSRKIKKSFNQELLPCAAGWITEQGHPRLLLVIVTGKIGDGSAYGEKVVLPIWNELAKKTK